VSDELRDVGLGCRDSVLDMGLQGGVAKGRRLDSPPVQLRPMMGKVKEALFSQLTGFGLFGGSRAPGSAGVRVLDLFSGSGGVGIEALSRGASAAVFVDFAKEVRRRESLFWQPLRGASVITMH
jgi:16S rRNA G966 N2-methylase RsmD